MAKRRAPQPDSCQKRRARADDIEPHVKRTVDWLRAAEGLHEPCTPTGYRNKMTYSMARGRVLTSPLGSEHCNGIVEAIGAWVIRELPEGEQAYFHEVGVKCSRAGSCMIRILVVCPADAFAPFQQKLREFAAYAVEAHRAECVFAQHSTSVQKPTKDDPYVYVHGAHLAETTPWGDPYIISPDTFSEVNHEVEGKMWDFYQSVLEEDMSADDAAAAPRELLLMGRDSNATLVSMFPKYHRVYRVATCLPHCPRVREDLCANYERCVRPRLAAGQSVEITAVDGKFAYGAKVAGVGAAVASSGGDPAGAAVDGDAGAGAPHPRQHARRVTVMVNSGRGGLARDTAAALLHNARIDRVVYVTCNQNTCYQDADVLLRGPHRFVVHRYRSFDFMPGTGYVMQIFVLRRAPRQLVIPVGPPGCGKSTVGAQLAALLPHGAVALERDAVFAGHRNAGMSLKAAKRATHEHLLSTLADPAHGVLYYDSTNGDPGGRALTMRTFRGAPPGAAGEAATAVLLHFSGMAFGWLLANCMARVGHVAFPSGEPAARQKIENVMLGLVPPGGGGGDGAADADGEPDGAARARGAHVVVQVNPEHMQPGTIASHVASLLLMSVGLARAVRGAVATAASVAVSVAPDPEGCE